MEIYNFDKPTVRRNTGSYKWDETTDPDVLPLWVADMDFEAAPPIQQALKARMEHGIFGYTLVQESYYEAVMNWFANRHNWAIDRQWILYTSGVIPALSCALRALTLPGEQVLVQTPVFNCFFSSIANCGCVCIENPLVRKGNRYEIDFDDFERKCSHEKTTVFVLCNPHNPAGRVWTREELARMNDICLRHGVRVVSDEIHCELVMPGHCFMPFAAVSPACLNNSVTLNSPTKAFNLAGLQIANVICSDTLLRNKINRAINIHEVCDVNPFGPVALQAAYNHCADWLDQLNNYVFENYRLLQQTLSAKLPKATLVEMEGTYLAWVDVSALGLTGDEAAEKLLTQGKLMVSSGTAYGREAGKNYIRINLACQRAVLHQALERLVRTLS